MTFLAFKHRQSPVTRAYSSPLNLSEDPMGYVDGMNWYQNRRSSPVKYADPFGEASLTVEGTVYELQKVGEHDQFISQK